MIAISQLVEQIIARSPYLREAISSNLINLSALARLIHGEVANGLKKDITHGSILICLQRLSKTIKPYYEVNPADYLANLSIRTELVEFTVKNSDELIMTLARYSTTLNDPMRTVFIFTQSQYETTILTSSRTEDLLRIALKDENITRFIPDLVGITLQRTHDQIETTGVLQFPLRVLAWEGISVIEIFTTLNEIMLIVRDIEVDRAVVAIRQSLAALKSK
jgi:hypothetical protein